MDLDQLREGIMIRLQTETWERLIAGGERSQEGENIPCEHLKRCGSES